MKSLAIGVAMMVASASVAMAATESQFDLECVGKESTTDNPSVSKPTRIRYSLDLKRGLFTSSSYNFSEKIASVTDDEITLVNGHDADGDTLLIRISRLDGAFANVIKVDHTTTATYGTCERKPYTNVPGPKF